MLTCYHTNAQDTVRIKHANYTTVYNKTLKYPVLVEWWETKTNDGCEHPLPRKDQFAPDPTLKSETDLGKDYVGSGYDRGHMCPAASNECMGSQVLTECFYFSNMVAQPHSLNAGDWKTLETLTRDMAIKEDSIHVWAGAVGSTKTFGSHHVAVPSKCWKVIYIVKTKEYQAYIFNNSFDKPIGLPPHKVNVSDVEKLTGFKFN
jgi:endonuclease G, mitochondrial